MVCHEASKVDKNMSVYHKRSFLNSQNNASYAYLESIDHDFSYDPHDVHPKFHERLYRCFDAFVQDGEKMTLTKVLQLPDRLMLLSGANDEEVEKMNNAIRMLCRAFSVTEEGLCREDWVEASQVFAEAERQRRRRGEQSLIALIGDACFDLVDEEYDGTVGIEELKFIMRSLQIPEEASYIFFDVANVDKSERLEREEIYDSFHNLWLEPYDPKYDYLYENKH